jgi:CRP/FNR family transcriptional regulator, cyclic AMP receptor protein
VKLSVANEVGKEAVVSSLGPGDFFGQGSIGGQSLCTETATAIILTTLVFIEKDEMIRVLHTEHAFSDHFVSYLLSRNIRIEEDLIDQLFNSSEKRLARLSCCSLGTVKQANRKSFFLGYRKTCWQR